MVTYYVLVNGEWVEGEPVIGQPLKKVFPGGNFVIVASYSEPS